MKKKKNMFFISLFFVIISIFSPIFVEAKTNDVYINHLEIKNMAKTAADIQCEANSACKSDAAFGNVDCPCSVAWLLQRLFNYIKILGPTIAIVLGSLDFVKAIITSDDENMKKIETKFAKRIVAAAMLFFIPLIVQILLRITGMIEYTGGLK